MTLDDRRGNGNLDPSDPFDDDVSRLLQEGSWIAGSVDVDEAWATGRRKRTNRRVATGMASILAAGAIVGVGYLAVNGALPGGVEPPVPPAATGGVTGDVRDATGTTGTTMSEPVETAGGRDSGVLGPDDVADVPASEGASADATGVRFGRHPGYDRAVIELEDVVGAPGWRVGYAEAGTAEPGGVSDLPAGQTLLIELRAETPSGPPGLSDTHRDVIGGLGLVRDAEFLGTEDGTIDLALSLPERYPYRVTYMEDPQRLVVDVYAETPDS